MKPGTAILMFSYAVLMPLVMAHYRMDSEGFMRYLGTWLHLLVVTLPFMAFIVWKLVECRREEKRGKP